MALNLNSELTISEFFEYINKEWFDVLAHSSYPLTKISDGYGIVPEFFYAYHGKIVSDIEINGQTVERKSLDEDNLKFKVNLNVVEHDGKYDVSKIERIKQANNMKNADNISIGQELIIPMD